MIAMQSGTVRSLFHARSMDACSVWSHSTLFTNPAVPDACTGATIIGWQILLHSRGTPSPMNGCFFHSPRCSPYARVPISCSFSQPVPPRGDGTGSGCPSGSLFHPTPVLVLPTVPIGLSTLLLVPSPRSLLFGFLLLLFPSDPGFPRFEFGFDPVPSRGRPAPIPHSEGIGRNRRTNPGRCVHAPIAWKGRPGAWSIPIQGRCQGRNGLDEHLDVVEHTQDPP